MIYDFSLQTVGFIAGIALILLSLPGLLKPTPVQDWLKRFPRSGVLPLRNKPLIPDRSRLRDDHRRPFLGDDAIPPERSN